MDARTLPKTPDTAATPVGTPIVHLASQGIALSPINWRRWQNFKHNRRGFFSLWIFLTLFVVSLLAEFIANDKPLFISAGGHWYFPVLVNYPDTTFGDKNDPNLIGTAADYRDAPICAS